MQVAVTGATGFLGANLVRALLGQGHRVRCLIRKPNQAIEGLEVEVEAVPLTGDPDALARALDGCEGVYHVAGLFDPSPDGEARMRTIHVDATDALCTAASRAGVRRLVLCSSSVTVGFGPLDSPGDEDTPFDADAIYGTTGALRIYHDTKLEAETRVRGATDIEGVVVNPDFILGPWDIKPTSGQLIVAMARRWVPVYPRGGKCFQTASDCAIGHIRAMERGTPGRRYLLGSHNLSYRDFMTAVAQIVGRKPPALAVPQMAIWAGAMVGSIGSRFDAHRFAGLNGPVLRSMQQQRYRSDDRARSELELQPEPIENGIERAYGWFKDQGYC